MKKILSRCNWLKQGKIIKFSLDNFLSLPHSLYTICQSVLDGNGSKGMPPIMELLQRIFDRFAFYPVQIVFFFTTAQFRTV